MKMVALQGVRNSAAEADDLLRERRWPVHPFHRCRRVRGFCWKDPRSSHAAGQVDHEEWSSRQHGVETHRPAEKGIESHLSRAGPESPNPDLPAAAIWMAIFPIPSRNLG